MRSQSILRFENCIAECQRFAHVLSTIRATKKWRNHNDYIYDATHNGLTIEIREQQAPVVGEVR
jgi:hypothetical protein